MRLGLATSSGLHLLDKRICANWARSNLGPLQRIYYIEIFGPSRASGVVPRLNLRRSSTPNCHYLGGLRVLPLQAVGRRDCVNGVVGIEISMGCVAEMDWSGLNRNQHGVV